MLFFAVENKPSKIIANFDFQCLSISKHFQHLGQTQFHQEIGRRSLCRQRFFACGSLQQPSISTHRKGVENHRNRHLGGTLSTSRIREWTAAKDIQISNLSSVFACLFGRKLWVFISTNHLTSTSLGMSFHVLPHFCDVWGQHGCVCFLHIGCQEVGRRVVCLVKRRLGRSETYIKSNAGNSAESLILESVWCLKNTLVPKNPSCMTFPCFESHPVVRFWVPSRR